MPGDLLERSRELAGLLAAVTDAAAGRGRIVLVTGEAGIGKTSLVRAFAARAAAPQTRARVLLTACDDLMAPRPLGPIRDAAGVDGPLAVALADDGDLGGVFAGLLAELGRNRPTVLVVEDVHWADDATLDVLLYAAGRIADLPAVLVLTVRDAVVDAHHPLRRLLGTLATAPVRRIALRPLSAAAIAQLSAGTGRDAATLHAVTGGNPFFVTETLAAERETPGGGVPVTVIDAVQARCRPLSPPCRAALEQLSVVPTYMSLELATILFGPTIDALAEAERAGVVEVRAEGLSFRHELARRAIEQSLPHLRRRLLNQAVVEAVRAQERPERARLVHHAVAAGDVETVLAVGPAAAREAARAGSHRQALALAEAVLPHVERLPAAERAATLDGYGWELYNAHRFPEAVRAGREAARLYQELDDAVALGGCLIRVSRHLFMAGETDEAEETAKEAVRILEPSGNHAEAAHALIYWGAIPALTDGPERAVVVLDDALDRAGAAGRDDLAVLCLNYLGIARAELGGEQGLRLLRDSVAAALAGGHREYAARGYTNLAELLLRFGRLDELDTCVREGLRYAHEHGFWSHSYNLEVHRSLLLLRRGDWAGAASGLRALVEGVSDPGMLYVYSVPWHARLLARRGDPAAAGLLAGAWARARRHRLLIGRAYAGLAYAEWAWLAGRPEVALEVADELLPRLAHPGAAPFRGELLRYLARAGLPVEPFPGCPAPYAAGLAGNWRAAAEGWRAIGDPYERALELVESAGGDEVAEGLAILDGLGASAAVERVRARLRAAGRPVPRGSRRRTRNNPAGLTDRQLAVLVLLREGLTNAEIAKRLVLSVRTVDHHVAAIFAKLGVHTRRAAVEAAGPLRV